MSRKKKVKPAPSAPGAALPGNPDAAALAASALDAARYKDAIEQFKALLKRERRAEWLAGLAAAYAGRAGQLAAKGMVKEALALWHTRAESCGVPLLGGPYVAWLIQSGQIDAALGLLPAVEALPAEARDLARAELAPAVLLAPERLLAGVPEDMLRHRAAARAALAACAGGDEAALAQALQAISFRSPYRDLRPLLKALALAAANPPSAEAAAASLAHVPPQGPFEPLAQAIRVCLMPGTEWLAGMRTLDDAGRALVLYVKGCPAEQRALVLDLMARAADTAPSPIDLYDLASRHRRAFPGGAARQLCLRLLPHAPQRLDAFRSQFPPLTVAEEERALALAADVKRQPDRAEAHWLQVVRSLRDAADGKRSAALVLRRLADEHSHHSPDGSLCVHALDWLQQSLELDPDDRHSHLRLVRDARQAGELKQARQWLDAARKRFPEDTPLLLEEVQTALAAGAFKKAAGLARQVLALDPINPQVRALVGQAHLSHARKLIAANNAPAARRELDEAATWLRGPAECGALKLLRGFAAESAGDGDALLREAVVDLGGPLVGGFHLLLEGKRVASRRAPVPMDLLRRAGVDPKATPGTAEVVALAQALHALPEGDAGVFAALAPLHGMLQRAASTLRFSEAEHLRLCEALLRQRQYALAQRFAGAALQRWPQRPVFVCLDAEARCGGKPWLLSERECDRLDSAFEQARAEGDQRTAARLSKLLDRADFGPGDDPLLADDDEPDADDLDQAVEAMLAVGGEDEFLRLARQKLGKTMFDRLRREIKGSNKQFARALVELLALSGPEPAPPDRMVPPRMPPARTTAPSAMNQPDLFDD